MNMSQIFDMVGISALEQMEVQRSQVFLLAFKNEFNEDLFDWLQRHEVFTEAFPLSFDEILLPEYYEAMVSGEYKDDFYRIQYLQVLKWLNAGLTQSKIMLVLSHIRQIFIRCADQEKNIYLAKGLCHVLDMSQSVVTTVFSVVETIERMEVHAEAEIQRLKRSFYVISADMPQAILQAYKDHQRWKLVTFNMALGRPMDWEGYEISHLKCRLAQWYHSGGEAMISEDARASFLVAHEKIHQLGVFAVEESKAQHPEKILGILTEMENSSLIVSDVLLEAIESEFVRVATADALTGLPNRRSFDLDLNSQIAFAKRHDFYVGLIMIDIDFFKQVNDRYGHAAGDQVLIQLAKILSSATREEEVAYRWGGEEFAIITLDSQSGGAKLLAERVRKQVENSVCRLLDGIEIQITVSLGSVCFKASAEQPLHEIFAFADKQLYKAKENGRNQVQHLTLE